MNGWKKPFQCYARTFTSVHFILFIFRIYLFSISLSLSQRQRLHLNLPSSFLSSPQSIWTIGYRVSRCLLVRIFPLVAAPFELTTTKMRWIHVAHRRNRPPHTNRKEIIHLSCFRLFILSGHVETNVRQDNMSIKHAPKYDWLFRNIGFSHRWKTTYGSLEIPRSKWCRWRFMERGKGQMNVDA